MTTARDLVTMALYDAGVFGQDQTPNAIDINNGLTRLNDMMSQWNTNRWLIYHLLDLSLPCTGATSYTIGPGQQFDTPRPDRLEDGCFIRQITPPAPNQPDWPLTLIQSREAYNNIRLKQLASFPQYIFYDSGFPTGLIYPWPLPSNLYELHILVKAQLQQFANLTDQYNMPAPYKRAIRFNLQEEMLIAYKLPPDEKLSGLARGALDAIRDSNFQMPVLRLPPELTRNAQYNYLTDNTI